MTVRVIPDSRGYVSAALRGLLADGWDLVALPAQGKLAFNRQLLTLIYLGTTKRFRLLIFKVGPTGRSRPDERRIEATSTYAGGGLLRIPNTEDVLLGFDADQQVFVGFDARRLEHGGPTQNASSFLDVAELDRAGPDAIHVAARPSELFGVEYQAFIHPQRLAEYLVNKTAIHHGRYSGAGQFSERRAARPIAPARESVEDTMATGDEIRVRAPASILIPAGPVLGATSSTELQTVETTGITGLRRRMPPWKLEELLRQARRNGELGEHIVIKQERIRLRRARRPDLADQVVWTSRDDVAAGYDIKSFETNGDPRYIEVKSTSGTAKKFVISRNEWQQAERHRGAYWIYIVTSVTGTHHIEQYQDPVALLAAGVMARQEREWIVTVV